jgi:hypothetical protein
MRVGDRCSMRILLYAGRLVVVAASWIVITLLIPTRPHVSHPIRRLSTAPLLFHRNTAGPCTVLTLSELTEKVNREMNIVRPSNPRANERPRQDGEQRNKAKKAA